MDEQAFPAKNKTENALVFSRRLFFHNFAVFLVVFLFETLSKAEEGFINNWLMVFYNLLIILMII